MGAARKPKAKPSPVIKSIALGRRNPKAGKTEAQLEVELSHATVRVGGQIVEPLPVQPWFESAEFSRTDLADLPRMCEAIRVPAVGGVVTQEWLAGFAHIKDAITSLEARLEQMKEVLLPEEGKGKRPIIEAGALCAVYSSTPSVRPKWKEEAIKEAEKVAVLEKRPFVEDAYTKKVQSGYKMSTSHSVAVVKSDRIVS